MIWKSSVIDKKLVWTAIKKPVLLMSVVFLLWTIYRLYSFTGMEISVGDICIKYRKPFLWLCIALPLLMISVSAANDHYYRLYILIRLDSRHEIIRNIINTDVSCCLLFAMIPVIGLAAICAFKGYSGPDVIIMLILMFVQQTVLFFLISCIVGTVAAICRKTLIGIVVIYAAILLTDAIGAYFNCHGLNFLLAGLNISILEVMQGMTLSAIKCILPCMALSIAAIFLLKKIVYAIDLVSLG